MNAIQIFFIVLCSIGALMCIWALFGFKVYGSSPEIITQEKPMNEDRPRVSLDSFSHDSVLTMNTLDSPYYLIQLRDEIKQLKTELEELRGK